MTQLSYSRYREKVLAGWIGKSIGGVIGAPLENHKERKTLTLQQLWPPAIAPNDDLDIQLVWLEALQERGLWLTSRDLVELWQDRCWYNFCEYGYFLYNAQRGIDPPLSGTWNNRFFRESEGCPIRSEIWGFVCPGDPQLAADFARLDATLDHGGESVFIEQFLSAAAANAMVNDDLEAAIAAGLSVIPRESQAAQAVGEVREICRRYPDHAKAWRLVIRRYGDRDASKAITNHAITLMCLFLGGGDFARTMLLCANSGWDTDCTAATAGALLSALKGPECLPRDWVQKLGTTLVCGIQVKHKNASLDSLTDDTCRLGVEMAQARSRAVQFIDAPAVTVRPAPLPTPQLRVEYPQAPVLWNRQTTPVRLLVHNPTSTTISGRLEISAPSYLQVRVAEVQAAIPAGQTHAFDLEIRRSAGPWLPDKNLIEARWLGTTLRFGLGGARQWQVYGPYWDMWDRRRNAICPYSNERVQRHPLFVGYPEDSYNHYADLDRAYLDEAALLQRDLPEEVPMLLEHGEDDFDHHHLGGFVGQACYYLVRTIRSTRPVEAILCIGRSGPVRAWLDGREVMVAHSPLAWDAHGSSAARLQLTGKPQRLVVKAVRPADDFHIGVTFQMQPDSKAKQGVAYIWDCLEDRVPEVGS